MSVKAAMLSSIACVVLAIPAIARAQETQGAASAPAGSQASDSIVATGVRASIESAVNAKKNADQVVDVVAAEDVGKLPDANVAENLQRVPGVQIER
ncbi:TonB-dependent receptor plug domain-containing protein, partial [Staphylococcus aureus]